MAFVYRNKETGAVYAIAEKASLCSTTHSDCECVEVSTDFGTLFERAQAAGSPVIGGLSFDETTSQFSFDFDVMVLVIEADGVELDMNSVVRIEGDGTTSALFRVRKRNIRTGEWQTAINDNNTLELRVGRGRLKNEDGSQNISSVQLVNGEAYFRLRSVDENAKTHLTFSDPSHQILPARVPVHYV